MKYHARTHDDIREIVPTSALDLSSCAEVPEIAAFCAGTAGRARGARHLARGHSRERIAQQNADTGRDIDRSGYAAHIVAPVQGYEVHQYPAICIRAGKCERGGQVIGRVDQITNHMKSELYTGACPHTYHALVPTLVGTRLWRESMIGVGVCLHSAAGFIRGGNWDNGTNDGAFTLNLNNAPSNVNTNIGFRCARYASSTNVDGQNKNSTEFSQRSHRSILTHSFFQAYISWRRISDLYIRFVLVATMLAKAQGGVSGSLVVSTRFRLVLNI